jgi:hypothetical protein
LDEEYKFLAKANIGNEFFDDDKIARIKKIGWRKWHDDGQFCLLLPEEEMGN